MKITSPAFENQQKIPAKYTCNGDNVNPPLQFEEVPQDAKSLVLLVDDPDVPKNLKADGIWDHWVVYNIPPDTVLVHEGLAPVGVVGYNTRGTRQYIGPCPPDREHRYFFKLFALDKTLTIHEEEATKKVVEEQMRGHILDEAELIGLYSQF